MFSVENKKTLILSDYGEELRFNIIKYSRRKNSLDKAFEPVDAFYRTLSPEIRKAMWAVYQKIEPTVLECHGVEEVVVRLRELCRELFLLIDWEYLRYWVHEHGDYPINSTIALTCPEEHDPNCTYVLEEYKELIVLSYYFKLICPMILTVTEVMEKLKEGIIEIWMCCLVDFPEMSAMPAMQKLYRYYTSWVENKEEELKRPIFLRNLGTVMLPKYFLGDAIRSRLCMEDTRRKDDTLVSVLYNNMNSKIYQLGAGIQDKIRKDLNDDEDPISQQYRISQDIQDMVVVVFEESTRDISELMGWLSPSSDPEKALGYIRLISSNPVFSISGYHEFFVSLMLYPVFINPGYMLRRFSREAYLRLIGVSAALISDLGFQELANLLISPRYEFDHNEITMNVIGGIEFSDFTEESINTLLEIYPNALKIKERQALLNANPGYRKIQEIVKEISSFDWDEELNHPVDLRNDIVKLIKIREEKLCTRCTQKESA